MLCYYFVYLIVTIPLLRKAGTVNILYREDFFIYVPSSNEKETPIHDTWERITLEEQVVVYTHMWHEELLVETNVSHSSVGTAVGV